MKDNQKVSVIITTYKRKFEEIKISLESVLKQTYRNIEIIIVDDNGKGTELQCEIEEKINKYESPFLIKYIINENNYGAQVSRNKGILNSTGEYLAFLDDDDKWENEKIELQIKEFKDENVGLVFSQGWLININDSKKKPYNMSKCFINRVDSNDMLYGDYIGTTSQVVIKREVFAQVGLFDVNQPARQDYEMWIRISLKYKCIGVKKYLFSHYIHSGEQISKNPIKSAIGMENIYKKYRKKMSKTSKWHILLLTAKAYSKTSKKLTFFNYLAKSAIYLILALFFDNKNLIKRIKIHKERIK